MKVGTKWSMSYVKRQELFKDLNPLLKKYKYDGPQPPSYIPPKKRKMITRYMGRSSFSPGHFGKWIDSFLKILTVVDYSTWRGGAGPRHLEDGRGEQKLERGRLRWRSQGENRGRCRGEGVPE